LLLPAERNKTPTALANTEPVVGAQRKEAQGLQWLLPESRWNPEEMNRRRMEIVLGDPGTAPQAGGALVVDETGDRKDGKATAHVGRQCLGGIGKIDGGVVSVSSLWVDERVYHPVEVEPYTPAHHFEGGKADPEFRTKPRTALELVERAVAMGLPFRAVVGDILYGEHRKFKEGLESREIPYVLSLKPSHAWWRPVEEVGWVEGVALASYWGGPEDPGDWVKLERSFRDGHTEAWWALEAECRAFGPEKDSRLVVATTDPATLPPPTSWCLATNLPAVGSKKAGESALTPANLAEVVRLYALSNHKAPLADGVLRLRLLLAGGFGVFGGRGVAGGRPRRKATHPIRWEPNSGWGGEGAATARSLRASRGLWRCRRVRAWLEPYVTLTRYWRAYTDRDPPGELRVLLERLFSGEGIYLYVH
jgi:hypothetical protein